MARRFLEITSTPAVHAARAHAYGRAPAVPPGAGRDALTADEVEFIGRRDSFYLSTVNADGWPYIQHRGGPPGFLHVLAPDRLAFADYQGNRQLLSTGNLAGNDRVALFLMDYPQRQRLKILGHARTVDARAEPALVAQLAGPAPARAVERLFLIDVVAYDWNCPKHITPRYSREEILELVAPLQQQVADLQAEIARLKQ